jgi:hypothetical protein
MADEQLAENISSKPPWWATAPIWLAAGIVGVPSLIAIMAGYFIAASVTDKLRMITTYDLSELHLLNEQINESKHSFDVVEKFIADDLKAQYQTCISASRTPEQRNRCITPEAREERYGIEVADPPGGWGGLTQLPTPSPTPTRRSKP